MDIWELGMSSIPSFNPLACQPPSNTLPFITNHYHSQAANSSTTTSHKTKTNPNQKSKKLTPPPQKILAPIPPPPQIPQPLYPNDNQPPRPKPPPAPNDNLPTHHPRHQQQRLNGPRATSLVTNEPLQGPGAQCQRKDRHHRHEE